MFPEQLLDHYSVLGNFEVGKGHGVKIEFRPRESLVSRDGEAAVRSPREDDLRRHNPSCLRISTSATAQDTPAPGFSRYAATCSSISFFLRAKGAPRHHERPSASESLHARPA